MTRVVRTPMVVVLPAPLGPMSPKNSPSLTTRSSPSSATVAPPPRGCSAVDGAKPGCAPAKAAPPAAGYALRNPSVTIAAVMRTIYRVAIPDVGRPEAGSSQRFSDPAYLDYATPETLATARTSRIMIFRRFYDDSLAQASYMIACERSSEAIVVDPNMDIETYLRAARDEGVRITAVTETHIHADFASGARALAAMTGAELHVSGEGGDGWQYSFAHEPGVNILHSGDEISIGMVRLDVHHTPGHTPEHLTFVLTDRARSDVPVGALTGDFLFVGDVGRPDLLERAAGQVGTMRAAAASLYASIQALKQLPDHLQIWPGHGAGSACGKAMSSAAQSTLGYERVANWA